MAIDWIKMRADLQSHPKVVRILSATKSDKFRVIGGLHAVWCVFDAHCEDGVLQGYTPETLDHIIGWNGFSSAMVSVGWLIENVGVSLAIPEFSEHNGQSAKRRAEDQKRKRDSRSSPEPVRNLSANDADEKQTRKEKIREEKSNTNTPLPPKVEEAAPPFVLPDWINAKHWDTWHSTPKRKKATTAQKQMAVDKLDAWRMANEDYAGALENAAIGGNQGLFLPNKPTTHAAPPETFKERDARLAREKWERMTGEQHPDHAQATPTRSILDVVDVEMKMIGAIQ